MHVGIIGAGTIGKELYHTALSRSWGIEFVLKRHGLYEDLEKKIDYPISSYLQHVDVVFLAISTKDNGEAAYTYITTILEANKPVVTCEKGALANYFPELQSKLPRLGYSATVGGGTQMLGYLQEMKQRGILEVHGVVNGTLNYIFSRIEKKDKLETIIQEAREKKLTEPGATDLLDIINNELCGDLPRKAAVLFNLCKFSSPIKAKDICSRAITDTDFKHIILSKRRCFLSITRKRQDLIGGFAYEAGDWVISVGFQQPHHLSFPLPCLEDNALSIKTSDGTYTVIGPGAGPKPTVAAMLGDALRMHAPKL